MKLITEIEIPPCPWPIHYPGNIVMMGSCFSENIGQRLAAHKFNVDLNPFGILYNPASILKSMHQLMEKKHFTPDDLFFDQGIWNSFSHHSSFSGINKEEVLKSINQRLLHSSNALRKADLLIITFGTAWVYEYKSTHEIVSNCHKLRASNFHRFRLGFDQIVNDFIGLHQQLLKINPNIKIIFTVSPIRHWKDGAIENQRSKATLLLAIDQIVKTIGEKYSYYFPSYEIVMDELRDYRYYASDMLHLSETAVEYIYEKFRQSAISPDTQKLAESLQKLQKAVHHRPFNPHTEEHKKFLLSNLVKIEQLTQKFPFLNLQAEKLYFQNCLQQFSL